MRSTADFIARFKTYIDETREMGAWIDRIVVAVRSIGEAIAD